MSINDLIHRSRFPATRWWRLAGAFFGTWGERDRSGSPELDVETGHDIGLRREHQDYSSVSRITLGSTQRLYSRAERIRAGLPE